MFIVRRWLYPTYPGMLRRAYLIYRTYPGYFTAVVPDIPCCLEGAVPDVPDIPGCFEGSVPGIPDIPENFGSCIPGVPRFSKSPKSDIPGVPSIAEGPHPTYLMYPGISSVRTSHTVTVHELPVLDQDIGYIRAGALP